MKIETPEEFFNNWFGWVERRISPTTSREDKHYIKMGMKECATVLLQKYSEFLEENGYVDTDWREEGITSIDRFLKK